MGLINDGWNGSCLKDTDWLAQLWHQFRVSREMPGRLLWVYSTQAASIKGGTCFLALSSCFSQIFIQLVFNCFVVCWKASTSTEQAVGSVCAFSSSISSFCSGSKCGWKERSPRPSKDNEKFYFFQLKLWLTYLLLLSIQGWFMSLTPNTAEGEQNRRKRQQFFNLRKESLGLLKVRGRSLWASRTASVHNCLVHLCCCMKFPLCYLTVNGGISEHSSGLKKEGGVEKSSRMASVWRHSSVQPELLRSFILHRFVVGIWCQSVTPGYCIVS